MRDLDDRALCPSLRSSGTGCPALRLAARAVRHLVAAAHGVARLAANTRVRVIIVPTTASRRPPYYTTAFTVFQLPHAIFAVSIFTAILPGMSERWSAGHPEGVRALVSRGLRDTAVVILPAAVGLLVLAQPISRLLFEHGAATPRDSAAIAGTLGAAPVSCYFQRSSC